MARPQYPSDRLAQFMVRMSEGLRERIRTAAAKNNRSMNAEIIAALEEVFPENEFDLAALITELSTALNESTSDEERQRAVDHANAELQSNNSAWRIQVSNRDEQKVFTIEAFPDWERNEGD